MCFRKSIVEAVIMNTLVQILCTFENLLGIKIWALSEAYKISTPETLKKSICISVLYVWESVHVCITLLTLPGIMFSLVLLLCLGNSYLDFTACFQLHFHWSSFLVFLMDT